MASGLSHLHTEEWSPILDRLEIDTRLQLIPLANQAGVEVKYNEWWALVYWPPDSNLCASHQSSGPRNKPSKAHLLARFNLVELRSGSRKLYSFTEPQWFPQATRQFHGTPMVSPQIMKSFSEPQCSLRTLYFHGTPWSPFPL